MSQRQTVLIVDDHADFRAAARSLLDAEGFDVVGEAADGPEALLEVDRCHPALVLLDIQLPGMDGIEVAAYLADGPEPPQVVLISSRSAVVYGTRLTAAPVAGFLAKSELTGAALTDVLS